MPDELSPRQKKLLKVIKQNPTITNAEAIRQAGYSKIHAAENAPKIMGTPKVASAIQEFRRQFTESLPNEVLIKKHIELLDSTKLQLSKSEEGMGQIEVPDNQARGKGLELAYKVKGFFEADQSKGIQLNGQFVVFYGNNAEENQGSLQTPLRPSSEDPPLESKIQDS